MFAIPFAVSAAPYEGLNAFADDYGDDNCSVSVEKLQVRMR